MIIKYNNKVVTHNSKWVGYAGEPGSSLPPYTLRLKFKDNVTPTFDKGTGVQVSSSPNIWDLTYENSDWSDLLLSHSNLLEVINANTTGVTNMFRMFLNCSNLISVPLFDTSSVTNMNRMFVGCSSLTSVSLFDTSNVTEMSYMFNGCSSLTSVPLFDTSKVTYMNSMFYNCTNVQTGALALYQQASSQVNPPTNHNATFYSCGRDTQTGAAELAQIPDDWK
jgi:surface protein